MLARGEVRREREREVLIYGLLAVFVFVVCLRLFRDGAPQECVYDGRQTVLASNRPLRRRNTTTTSTLQAQRQGEHRMALQHKYNRLS